RAISITPSMAHLLIQTLKSENVEFMVAPYEADAQLAYLSSLGEEHGGIVAVISEDSDLLAYGCPSVIFKMDRFGNAEEILLDKVFNSTDSKPSFRNFNTILFIGCDFLPSIPGIGIVKAHALVSKYRNIDRVLSVLKSDKGKQVPDDYARSFREAVAVFEHATIYNKKQKRLEHIKELPEALLESLGGELDFLGPHIPPTIATAIAEGNLDPSTMEAYECSVSQQLSTSAQTLEQCELSASTYSVEGVLASPCQIRTANMTGAAQEMIQNFKVKNYTVPDLPEPQEQSQSCFTVYSSRNTASTMMVKRQALKERNFSDEAATLSKLVNASEVHNNEDNSAVSEEFPVRTPDNNPFRKRKLHSDNIETTPTTKSPLTEDDQSELTNLILHSQDSVNSKTQKLDKINENSKVTKKGNISRNIKSSILNFFARI
ncbi:Exonuclease 1, partial [Bienertia sinuspersici]